jgi:hypothetical protein
MKNGTLCINKFKVLWKMSADRNTDQGGFNDTSEDFLLFYLSHEFCVSKAEMAQPLGGCTSSAAKAVQDKCQFSTPSLCLSIRRSQTGEGSSSP